MSTVGSVLAALTSLASTTLPGTLPPGWTGDAWQVINGPLTSVTVRADLIALIGDGDVVGEPMSVSVPGENYLVPVTFSASLPGTDQLAADDLAMDAMAAFRTAVREWPTKPPLGVVGVLQAFPLEDFRFQRASTEEVRNAAVRFDIRITAHAI